MKYRLDGVVVSLNTPFEEGGRVDFASLERLVEAHLREGAVGLLTTAQAAGVYELTLDERIQIARPVKQAAAGRAEVIAGTTARELRESFALAGEELKAGCEGVLVEVPETRKGERRATSSFLESFASFGMPVLMPQDLDWAGRRLKPEE